LASRWGLTRPIIKSHAEEKWAWPWAREASQTPLNISAMAEASEFKFGMQLGFAKAHHKITPRGKVDVALGYWSSLKFWGSPLIFLQRLKLAISNLVCSLSLPSPIIKSHPKEKKGVALSYGNSQKFGVFP